MPTGTSDNTSDDTLPKPSIAQHSTLTECLPEFGMVSQRGEPASTTSPADLENLGWRMKLSPLARHLGLA